MQFMNENDRPKMRFEKILKTNKNYYRRNDNARLLTKCLNNLILITYIFLQFSTYKNL